MRKISFVHIVRNPTLIYLSNLVKSECVSLLKYYKYKIQYSPLLTRDMTANVEKNLVLACSNSMQSCVIH